MALGYQAALCLEGLGLLFLAASIRRLKVEKQAQANELRATLRTGADARTAPRRRAAGDRVQMVPHVFGAGSASARSEALHALRRAFTR